MKRPMLAVTCEDVTKINYPVLASYKLDGIRCIIKDSVVYSRSMKPIPSEAVQEKFGKAIYNGFDGELIYGDPGASNVFNLTTSFCMSHKIPEGIDKDLIFLWVFDKWDEQGGFEYRFDVLVDMCLAGPLKLLPHHIIDTAQQLNDYETAALKDGFEGVMVRSLDGLYKQGRSTLKQGWLLKIKRFKDDEAIITGFIEKRHNTNEAVMNERGYTKRSAAKEGMVGAGTLGVIVAKHPTFGEIEIGSGFNDDLRTEIWNNKGNYLGKLVKFKYFEVGTIDKPRFPVYLGIRSKLDT